jgi:hypothetical protein
MTFQTRTIAKRPGTYMEAGETGVHVNRITLRAEPWDKPELKPELKPEHQRPAPGRFAPISVRTPTVAKVKVLQPDRFAQWDQDVLADEWKALCRREGHMRGLPLSTELQRQRGSAGGLVSQQHDGLPDYMARALRHFSRGDDTTNGMAAAIKMSDSRGKEAVRKLRSYGFIQSTAHSGGRSFHAITQLGLEAICK